MVTIFLLSDPIVFLNLCVHIAFAVIRRMVIMMMVMDSIAPYCFSIQKVSFFTLICVSLSIIKINKSKIQMHFFF